jgi:hypothetical protein
VDRKLLRKSLLVIDESRIETDCSDGDSQLKGPSDAAEALCRGSTDHICGLQIDEQTGAHTHLGRCWCLDFAAYVEPSDDVVAETSPDSLHRYLDSSAAPKLAESTSLLDPSVRELSDL